LSQKEQLYYLLKAYKQGKYDIATFCSAYYDAYYPDKPDDSLNELEIYQFEKLADVVSRYTSFEDDLRTCPKAFASGEEIDNAIREVCCSLNIGL